MKKRELGKTKKKKCRHINVETQPKYKKKKKLHNVT